LILDEKSSDFQSKPYPFYLAYPIEGEPSSLGNPDDWAIEHKWDGIRSQTIIRDGEIYVWSRGEELVTDKYPEFQSFIKNIPDGTVIDGEILPTGRSARSMICRHASGAKTFRSRCSRKRR
jgi:DNA ligase-1